MADEDQEWGDLVDASTQKQMAEDFRKEFVYWSKLAVESYKNTLSSETDLSISDQWDQFYFEVEDEWAGIQKHLINWMYSYSVTDENFYHFKDQGSGPLVKKFRRKFYRLSTLKFVMSLRKKAAVGFESRADCNFERRGLFWFKFDNSDVRHWLQDFEFVNNLEHAFTSPKEKRFRLPLVCWFKPSMVPDDQRNTELNQNRLQEYNSIYEQFKSKWNSEAYPGDQILSDEDLQWIFQQRASMAWFEIVYALTKYEKNDIMTRPNKEFQEICQKHGISHHYTIDELRAENYQDLGEKDSQTCVLAKHMSNPYLISQ